MGHGAPSPRAACLGEAGEKEEGKGEDPFQTASELRQGKLI